MNIKIQEACNLANADQGHVIELRAKLEILQDELAEAEKKAGASKRAAMALMTEADASC